MLSMLVKQREDVENVLGSIVEEVEAKQQTIYVG